MDHQLHILVNQWLHCLHIPLSRGYVTEKLLSHPDYPSLLSVSETLDDLAIENAALIVDKEKLKEIPVPFLAHTNVKKGNFILVTDVDSLLRKQPDFYKIWDGIVAVAERPAAFKDTENEWWLAKEKRSRQRNTGLIIALAGISVFAALPDFSWFTTGFLLAALAGIFISVLLVQQEAGSSNTFADQVCNSGKNTDCDAVLHSKRSKLFDWLSMTDLGIIWFSTIFLFITVSLLTGLTKTVIPVLTILALLPLPMTFFSIWYQWRVIKKWCVLCLFLISTIWVQAIIVLPGIRGIYFNATHLQGAGLLAFSCIVIALGWLLLLKPLLNRGKETVEKSYRLQQFKNNLLVFRSVLERQRFAGITELESDLQIGDATAPVQLLVACNPYCMPCARAHHFLHDYLEKRQIGFTIRFVVNADNREDRKTKAVTYLLQLLERSGKEYRKKVLYDWYRLMDIDKFSQLYPLQQPADIRAGLLALQQWKDSANIKFTPTVFINGYELPDQYSIYDLPVYMNRWMNEQTEPVFGKEKKRSEAEPV